MKTIILDAQDPKLEDDIAELIKKHLQDLDFGVDMTHHYNGQVCMISKIAKEIADTPATELPPEPPVASEPPVEVTLNMGSVASDVPPASELPPEPTELPAPPVMTAPALKSLECCVMSLSTECAVEATVDPSVDVSRLNADHVQRMGEFVMFDYCGMNYRFPVEVEHQSPDTVLNTTSPTVCNTQKTYTPTSIRVAIKFINSDTVYPVLLSVEGRTDGSPYSITIGRDLAELGNIEMEKNHNDQVSTQ